MSALTLRLHDRPRWRGWAVTAAVHAALLLALASAFAPRPKAAIPLTISARLLPSSAAPAPTTTPVPVELPRAMLSAPPVPDIPPPTVQIEATPPVSVATTPLRFDPPGASAPAIAAELSSATAPRPVAVAAVTAVAATTMPPPPVPVPSETPAGLPADHRLCSERQTTHHYPAMLRERGIQGQVLLRVKVDAEGRAAEVVVAGGSGWRLLDEAARRVAESCPYIPARRGDQRLVSWVEYPVRFALQPSTLQ
ncbi:energy transducer TonB [Mitsuaria sp. GD03876]|uniref:energy transducer TonB n=1 Tax=Mitsuaria sp. GD03876 TaxID=2975399 RepID=UPI002448C39F|nr:energy transducer TonB [Mitsuaria sp. GD03876]MDH0863379.1 energy transducer TonB [Mitsuaria sp. GD03876]